MTEENKKLVRRFFDELVNERKSGVAEEIFSPNFSMPQLGLYGPEGAKSMVNAIWAAFPDAWDTIEEQVAEGDTVMTRVTVRGTNLGEWQGLPPTGKSVVWTGVTIDRVIDRKIVERLVVIDWLAVMKQLGYSMATTATR